MSEAGLDFDLGEMADTIRETTQRFAARQDRADRRRDRREATNSRAQLWPQMGELGLHGITVEEE